MSERRRCPGASPRLVLPILLAASVLPAARAREVTDTPQAAITAEELREHVEVLASEALGGRETTTEGERRAAAFLAADLERSGLLPAGEDGTFLQPFPVPRPVLGEGNRLTATTPEGDLDLPVEESWNPFSLSPNATAEGDLVFAGYGITAPERAWDDYAGLDVEGKVVLVLRKDPGWGDTRRAAFTAKLENAVRHGAAALLLTNDPATVGDGPDRIGHWSAPVGGAAGSGKIPFAFVAQGVAARLLAPLGDDLAGLEARLRASGPASASVPGVRVRITTALGQRREQGLNVVAWLPGTDPRVAHEHVVVGAHYDHLGRGRFGSLGGSGAAGALHPGADDNASGTASLLELAEHFADPARRPRRSLLFLAFGGEEMGLLGSRHYVAHPLRPLEDVVAMVNLDMVGRPRQGRVRVGGVGTGDRLEAIVTAANAAGGLQLQLDPQGAAPSDSISFFRRRMPVLFFFTGIHDDYHRPSDTPDKLDYVGMERVVTLVRDVVRDLADARTRLVYTDPPAPARRPRLGVSLGGEEDERGVPVAGVVDGGPAARAGLEPGDVIVALAGHIVRSSDDLLRVLGGLEPGRKVVVVVLRGDARVELHLTLGGGGRR